MTLPCLFKKSWQRFKYHVILLKQMLCIHCCCCYCVISLVWLLKMIEEYYGRIYESILTSPLVVLIVSICMMLYVYGTNWMKHLVNRLNVEDWLKQKELHPDSTRHKRMLSQIKQMLLEIYKVDPSNRFCNIDYVFRIKQMTCLEMEECLTDVKNEHEELMQHIEH